MLKQLPKRSCVIMHPIRGTDYKYRVVKKSKSALSLRMEELNAIGGRNGVGLADLVENRLVGMKSRGVYETPGGSILYRAHQVLETICLDRETQHYKEQVALKYAELIYFGQWYTPLREAIAAFVEKTQENVTGEVKLKLYKGNMFNAGVSSPYSLFNQDFSTFDKDEVYNQQDADGFIRLFGLPITVRAIMEEKHTRGKDTVVIGKRD